MANAIDYLYNRQGSQTLNRDPISYDLCVVGALNSSSRIHLHFRDVSGYMLLFIICESILIFYLFFFLFIYFYFFVLFFFYYS